MRCLLILLAISSCLAVQAIRENTDIVDGGGSDTNHQRSASSTADKDNLKSNYVTRNALDESRNLFPNRTEKPKFLQSHISANVTQNRLLSFRNDPYPSQRVVCEKCSNLTTCQVLNNLLIQEVYYPKLSAYVTTTTSKTGTCEIIEQRGIRLSLEIFGVDKTFRDTPTCRDIVMQYLCLFWGSDNSMYTNFCIYQEDVSDPNPINHKLSPRQPCRSFCVQVATVCANNADQFYVQCGEILCPPTQDTCTPDPVLGQQSLSANLGCLLPFYLDPYAPKNRCSKSMSSNTVASVIIIITFLAFILFL